MPSYSYAPSSAPAKPPAGYPAPPPGQTIYASQPYTKTNPDGSQTTTQKSLRCYCPWSLLLICLGVSLLVSAIINLITTAWVAVRCSGLITLTRQAAILGVLGALALVFGIKKWRADKAKTARGEHVCAAHGMATLMAQLRPARHAQRRQVGAARTVRRLAAAADAAAASDRPAARPASASGARFRPLRG